MVTKRKIVIPDYKIKAAQPYPVRVITIEAVVEGTETEAEATIEAAIEALSDFGCAKLVRNQLIDHTLEEAAKILNARHG